MSLLTELYQQVVSGRLSQEAARTQLDRTMGKGRIKIDAINAFDDQIDQWMKAGLANEKILPAAMINYHAATVLAPTSLRAACAWRLVNLIPSDQSQLLPLRIKAINEVLREFGDKVPEMKAMLLNELGHALAKTPQGIRANNIDKAIKTYQAALEFYTQKIFPNEWAAIQNNLGIIWRNRIHGIRADNIEEAIKVLQAALEVYTQNDFPEQRAATQNNLGNAWRDCITR